MSNNSLGWKSLLEALSDSDELMSPIINDGAKFEYFDWLQESEQDQLAEMLRFPNIPASADISSGLFSCQTRSLQTRINGELMYSIIDGANNEKQDDERLQAALQTQQNFPVGADVAPGVFSCQTQKMTGELMRSITNEVKFEKREDEQLLESNKNLLQPAAGRPYQNIPVTGDVAPEPFSFQNQNLDTRMIDELMSSMTNFEAEKTEDYWLQESSETLPRPAAQLLHHYQNISVSSTHGGCVMNPLGTPSTSQSLKIVPAAASPVSDGQSSSELPIPGDMPDKNKGRKRAQEGTEEFDKMKMKIKMKNRISAAKSRAKRLERERDLEREAKHLRNENGFLKRILLAMVNALRTKLLEEGAD